VAGVVRVGTIVRVPLHGRRVRGWVVADDVEPEADATDLRLLAKVVSAGPPPDVIELCHWTAWRYAGPVVPILRAASPPNVVPATNVPERATAVFPQTPMPAGLGAREPGRASVLVWPPASDRRELVRALVASEGSTIVVVPDARSAAALATDLRGQGRHTLVMRGDRPDAERAALWAQARGGACVVVGGRVALFAPVPDLQSIVVLDEGDEALKEERTPAWHARDVALERAHRARAHCTLVSPAPTLESVTAAGPPERASRGTERDGWPRLEVVDLRDEPPGRGLFSDALTGALRAAVEENTRPVCVLNRTGRARLLTCGRCGRVAQCEVCDAAVVEDEIGFLCERCGANRPRICLHCHSTRFSARRAGITRVRDEIAALLPRSSVADVDATTDGIPEADILVGTEAVLHRVSGRPFPVGLVAFLEFDQELLATRYRAAEQAMWLLVRAARVVGGRRAPGRVLVQTRVPDHELITAARAADPTIVADAERARRRVLGFPPFGGLAEVSGAPEAVDVACASLRPVNGLEVLGPAIAGTSARALVQAPSTHVLCDALAGVDLAPARARGRLRVDVDPLRV
jgi:primosomal protein N' (replication factor Y) (superfamily II helicase)